jgi:iron complex transport system ATP-binding protein
VLAVQAPVVLLDEPTTHLDAPHQRAVLRCITGLVRQQAAVAAVLHDLTLALAADRVVVMDQGRIRATGSPGDPALHAAIEAVFEQAIIIEPIGRTGVDGTAGTRWVAVPAP